MRQLRCRDARPAVAVAVLALGVAACGDERALRIAVHSGPSAAFLAVAAEEGLLAAEGSAVQLLELPSAEAVREAVVGGRAHGMAGPLGEVLAALGVSRYRPRVVLVTESRGDDMDVIAFDAGIIRARAFDIAAVIRAVDAARRGPPSRAATGRRAVATRIPPGLAAQRVFLQPGGAVERLAARVQAARAGGAPDRPPRLLLDLAAPEVLELAARH